ncbi:ATP-binding protein [Mariniphaga sp.]|uniref:ATP-binding protein n=1 Tax=Mariniphaga sp. TaxID=1954475 RepID=UPI0035618ACC
MKNRKIGTLIEKRKHSKTGRIIVFTGARQTGKTTLSRRLFPEYKYVSIEDPVMRSQYAALTAGEWVSHYPLAVLDEVQKEPKLIESIKSVYDQYIEPRYVLLGSSQFLLLEKVKESLAGRCSIFELFPLTLPEMITKNWDEPVQDSFFQQILKNNISEIKPPSSFLLDEDYTKKKQAWDFYQKFGGYPAVSDSELDDEEKYDWLQNYVKTYLERDIRDLASFRDLEPIIKLQRFLALNTATLLNASSMAAQTGITAKTVQRYIHYFELSYQAILLQAWSRNKTKRLVKTPKIHFLDNGIVQAILQKKGGLTGPEFESLVVAELYKQAKSINAQVSFYHLRTHDGKEVDLLIELPEGYLAFEIKLGEKIRKLDAKHLMDLETILDKPLLHGFLLSNDNKFHQLAANVTSMHAASFLG